MKITSKLMITLGLTLILSLVSLTVWAAPGRQGTIPLIPVTGGAIQVNYLCDCTEEATITRIMDPKNELGPAPTGFDFLSDTFDIDNVCEMEICYPYPEDYENQNGQIYTWNAVSEDWEITDSYIYGEPKQICTVVDEPSEKIYSLISADEILSLLTPSNVTLCGCSADDTITNVENPETEIGAAPAGMTILTDATKVDCSEACEVEVCYPYTEDYKSKDGQIYEWDEITSSWTLENSTIKGDPEKICTVDVDSTGGLYTLIGK